MRYWGTGTFTREEAERRFTKSLALLLEQGFGKRWIVSKETGDGLGFGQTNYIGEGCVGVSPDEVEIGWMLTPSAWGQGYGTEAARAIRDEAFERLELDSIIAMYHSENVASGRIMEKLGMSYERDVDGWGQGVPLRLYRLTREEWEALA